MGSHPSCLLAGGPWWKSTVKAAPSCVPRANNMTGVDAQLWSSASARSLPEESLAYHERFWASAWSQLISGKVDKMTAPCPPPTQVIVVWNLLTFPAQSKETSSYSTGNLWTSQMGTAHILHFCRQRPWSLRSQRLAKDTQVRVRTRILVPLF